MPIVLAALVWSLVAIGATYVAIGLLLVGLARAVRPHLGWVGSITALFLALAGWMTLIPAVVLITAGFGLHRLRPN